MRDAAPFASLSTSSPASTPASPSPTRRPPGDAGFETHRVRTGVLLGDIDALPRGDGDRVPGDGSPGDGAGDAMGCTGTRGVGTEREPGMVPGLRARSGSKCESTVCFLSWIRWTTRLAELAGSGSGETGGEAVEAPRARGHLDRLLRSPPWSDGGRRRPRGRDERRRRSHLHLRVHTEGR